MLGSDGRISNTDHSDGTSESIYLLQLYSCEVYSGRWGGGIDGDGVGIPRRGSGGGGGK